MARIHASASGPLGLVPVSPRVFSSGLLDLPRQHRQTRVDVSVRQVGRPAFWDLEHVPNAKAMAVVVGVAHRTERQ